MVQYLTDGKKTQIFLRKCGVISQEYQQKLMMCPEDLESKVNIEDTQYQL